MWCEESQISLDGYSSASLDQNLARFFAHNNDYKEGNLKVLLVIKIMNETGKHYFSLDTKDYSCYPEEQEILLQAGLIFNV